MLGINIADIEVGIRNQMFLTTRGGGEGGEHRHLIILERLGYLKRRNAVNRWL